MTNSLFISQELQQTKTKAHNTESQPRKSNQIKDSISTPKSKQQALNMHHFLVLILSMLALHFSFHATYTEAASLRNMEVEEDLNLHDQENNMVIENEDSSFHDLNSQRPRSCPPGAIPAVCEKCQDDGCSAFKCSAFTKWTCPPTHFVCGIEHCAFTCPAKLWCMREYS